MFLDQIDINQISKVNWACRRGMLELDLLLSAFVDDRYPALSDAEKEAFVRLLSYSDPEIFAWVFGKISVNEPSLTPIVNAIKQYGRTRFSS